MFFFIIIIKIIEILFCFLFIIFKKFNPLKRNKKLKFFKTEIYQENVFFCSFKSKIEKSSHLLTTKKMISKYSFSVHLKQPKMKSRNISILGCCSLVIVE